MAKTNFETAPSTDMMEIDPNSWMPCKNPELDPPMNASGISNPKIRIGISGILRYEERNGAKSATIKNPMTPIKNENCVADRKSDFIAGRSPSAQWVEAYLATTSVKVADGTLTIKRRVESDTTSP